ncbi:MAG TPA: copper-binding protein [Phenylobacterium sp.]|uniref:copper-binding protein n=1 Tax=Phenylobacterium sp. TaxID=1871053 RepID=UPI002B4A6097|nr:copper-binding protein [Phenylobacterium sp.]HKR88006.1 copper-binding protein [Phenylobacterium sp.]
MKFVFAAAAALLIATPALAQTAEPDAHASHHAAQTTVQAVGQIKSVDARAGTVTIHHGPIAALGWPAMTMSFKAAPDALLVAKSGQAVKFTLKTPDNEIVAIEPQ